MRIIGDFNRYTEDAVRFAHRSYRSDAICLKKHPAVAAALLAGSLTSGLSTLAHFFLMFIDPTHIPHHLYRMVRGVANCALLAILSLGALFAPIAVKLASVSKAGHDNLMNYRSNNFIKNGLDSSSRPSDFKKNHPKLNFFQDNGFDLQKDGGVIKDHLIKTLAQDIGRCDLTIQFITETGGVGKAHYREDAFNYGTGEEIAQEIFDKIKRTVKYYNSSITEADLMEKCCIIMNNLHQGGSAIIAEHMRSEVDLMAVNLGTKGYFHLDDKSEGIDKLQLKGGASYSAALSFNKEGQFEVSGHLNRGYGLLAEQEDGLPPERFFVRSAFAHKDILSDVPHTEIHFVASSTF